MVFAKKLKRGLMTKLIDSNMNFLPSSIHNGRKLRAIANEIYSCQIDETFQQFLEDHAIGLIEDEWWLIQEGLKNSKDQKQNALFRSADAFIKDAGRAHKENAGREKIFSVPCSGLHLAWLVLCYDLLCLKHKFSLPKGLIERLKLNREFQSARYEIAIGAILLRAGCDIRWIDTKLVPDGEKSCELIATHRRTKISFGVEAKSKKRLGSLNEEGSFSHKSRGIADLLHLAIKQCPEDLPFVIFIDINLPFEDGQSDEEKLIYKEIKRALGTLKSIPLSPSPINSIIGTNFPFHYDNTNPPSPTEHLLVQASEPKHPFPAEILDDIRDSLIKYGQIPEKI